VLTDTEQDRVQVSFRIEREWYRKVRIVLAESGKTLQEVALAGLAKEVDAERKRLIELRKRRKEAEQVTIVRRQKRLSMRNSITTKEIAAKGQGSKDGETAFRCTCLE
jgi:hypothetical protein